MNGNEDLRIDMHGRATVVRRSRAYLKRHVQFLLNVLNLLTEGIRRRGFHQAALIGEYHELVVVGVQLLQFLETRIESNAPIILVHWMYFAGFRENQCTVHIESSDLEPHP